MADIPGTMPTDCMDGIDDLSDGDASSTDSNVWGRLWPLGSSFSSFGTYRTLQYYLLLVIIIEFYHYFSLIY